MGGRKSWGVGGMNWIDCDDDDMELKKQMLTIEHRTVRRLTLTSTPYYV